MMVRVLPPRLRLLEGAEGSQVVISPRQGVGSLPAGSLPVIPMPQVITEFILASLFEGKFLVREDDGGDRTHFFLWFFCKTLILTATLRARAQARLADFLNSLPLVTERTEPPGAAPGWEKHPIFAEGPLAASSEHPHAMWDAAAGGGAQPHAQIRLISSLR